MKKKPVTWAAQKHGFLLKKTLYIPVSWVAPESEISSVQDEILSYKGQGLQPLLTHVARKSLPMAQKKGRRTIILRPF